MKARRGCRGICVMACILRVGNALPPHIFFVPVICHLAILGQCCLLDGCLHSDLPIASVVVCISIKLNVSLGLLYVSDKCTKSFRISNENIIKF